MTEILFDVKAPEEKSMRLRGIRNICVGNDDFYYLIFYDIDKPITTYDVAWIEHASHEYKISFFLFTTLHGSHYIGLTPLDILEHARVFHDFKSRFKSYYSGGTIRLSRINNEQQTLIRSNLDFGEVIPNLHNLYCERFGFTKLFWTKETAKYRLQFENYYTFDEEKIMRGVYNG